MITKKIKSTRQINKIMRMRGKIPFFTFSTIRPTENLKFELLSKSNSYEIYKMFKKDKSPYVSESFKDRDKLKRYVDLQLKYYKFISRGACDWLFKSKSTGEYLGIISLIELTTFCKDEKDNYCFIAFATKQSQRGKHYTTEAVNKLIEYAFRNYNISNIFAFTNENNVPSMSLLKKIGFENFSFRRCKFAYHKKFFQLPISKRPLSIKKNHIRQSPNLDCIS